MQIHTYPTYSFLYNVNKRMFYTQERFLVVPGYRLPFPNQGKKFRILNPKTGGFRIMKLEKETDTHFLFTSEDGIKAEIKKARD